MDTRAVCISIMAGIIVAIFVFLNISPIYEPMRWPFSIFGFFAGLIVVYLLIRRD